MKRVTAIVLIVLLQCLQTASYASNELAFPTESQRKEIAAQLFSGIESIDAMTIDLRNKTRRIDWDTYKKKASDKIAKAADWDALYHAISNIHFGILNRHSYLLVSDSVRDKLSKRNRWPKIEVGYTWPNVEFFSLANNKSIASINSAKIADIYDEFFNLYCNDVHHSGCLGMFSSYLKSGYMFSGSREQLVVKYTDGSSETFNSSNQPNTQPAKQQTIDCSLLYSSFDIDLIYDGSQSCLYESADTYVLKIFYFGNWGTKHEDIYCENTNEKGMCFDINEIKRITRSSPLKSLVIDLQDNGGGNENTPWIAALTTNGFKDNLVAYRNLSLLANPNIRESAFYYSESAETWYQNIVKNVETSSEFLPIRPDFCRGSKACDIKTVESSDTPIKYKDLKLVINRGCVSSCDDFIWRTRQYANATTYGQLSATDGAYARLNGYLFINKAGKVTNIITGEGELPPEEHGTLLVTYQVPISKTVNIDGEILEGAANILDYPLPVNKQNFKHLTRDNLARALTF